MPRFIKLTGEFDVVTGEGAEAVTWRFVRTVEIERAFTLADASLPSAPLSPPSPPRFPPLPLMLQALVGWEGVLDADGHAVAYSEQAFHEYIPSELRVEVLRQWTQRMRSEAGGDAPPVVPVPLLPPNRAAPASAPVSLPGDAPQAPAPTPSGAAAGVTVAGSAATSGPHQVPAPSGASLERVQLRLPLDLDAVAAPVTRLARGPAAGSGWAVSAATGLPAAAHPGADEMAATARSQAGAPETSVPVASPQSVSPADDTPQVGARFIAPDGVGAATRPAPAGLMAPTSVEPGSTALAPRLDHVSFALGAVTPDTDSFLDDPSLDPSLGDAVDRALDRQRRADVHGPLF